MAHFLTVLFIIIKQSALPMILYIFFYKQQFNMHIFYAFGLYNYFLQEIVFTMPFDNWPAGLSFFFARREFILSSYNVFHVNNLIAFFHTVLRCNLCWWVCFKYIFFLYFSEQFPTSNIVTDYGRKNRTDFGDTGIPRTL